MSYFQPKVKKKKKNHLLYLHSTYWTKELHISDEFFYWPDRIKHSPTQASLFFCSLVSENTMCHCSPYKSNRTGCQYDLHSQLGGCYKHNYLPICQSPFHGNVIALNHMYSFCLPLLIMCLRSVLCQFFPHVPSQPRASYLALSSAWSISLCIFHWGLRKKESSLAHAVFLFVFFTEGKERRDHH